MAKRPVFVPRPDASPFFEEVEVEFRWFAGMAKSQAQKSIDSLHEAAGREHVLSPVLEISSKSRTPLGVDLSAFNLMLTVAGQKMSVECAFQGSKVFENAGPFPDLYYSSSRDAKTDERLKSSGGLIAFRLFDEDFPLTPPTAFYDWLYLMALRQNPVHAEQLLDYAAFSDIAFNPAKSLNCQARSAALFVGLRRAGIPQQSLEEKASYLRLLAPLVASVPESQGQLGLIL